MTIPLYRLITDFSPLAIPSSLPPVSTSRLGDLIGHIPLQEGFSQVVESNKLIHISIGTAWVLSSFCIYPFSIYFIKASNGQNFLFACILQGVYTYCAVLCILAKLIHLSSIFCDWFR